MQQDHPKYLRIEDFSYHLPEDRIAHFPKEERDLSKLLIYENGNISADIYRNLAAHLSADSLIVFNQTKVVQVRLLFKKESGAGIEIFCLEPDDRYADMQTAMTQKGSVFWKCLVGGANKWKNNTVLSLYDAGLNITVSAHLEERCEGFFIIKLDWDNETINFAEVLYAIGKVPLPPYMNREMREEDKERYQTIYAKEEGSVAAPTAGLHFTDAIFKTLSEKNIKRAYLTLHVGAGTFKQVKSEQLDGHQMHAEWMEISREFLKEIYEQDGAITAVGTTSMRTLESLYWIGVKLHEKIEIDWNGNAVNQWDPYDIVATVDAKTALAEVIKWMDNNNTNQLITRTQIIIAPSYQPKIVTQLVTNFHQPNSTLLLLIAALTGTDWKKMYDYALENEFRFLSYGDGCLIKF